MSTIRATDPYMRVERADPLMRPAEYQPKAFINENPVLPETCLSKPKHGTKDIKLNEFGISETVKEKSEPN